MRTMAMAALALVVVLAGCGADGPPVAPQAGGVTVSGDARLGVTGGVR